MESFSNKNSVEKSFLKQSLNRLIDNKNTIEYFAEIIGSSVTSITKINVENFVEIIGSSITSIREIL